MPPQSIPHDSPNPQSCEILPFGPSHLEGAVRLSRQAGWPHRLEDWRMALSLSQGVAAVENGTELVGTVLVTVFGPETATINMVIVDQSRRGRGLGRQLMQAALRIGSDRNLRLTATPDGMSLYRQLGFSGDNVIAQHQGPSLHVHASSGATPADSGDIPAILALDRVAYGADRAGLISAIAEIGRFAVLRQGQAVSGYAARRPFGRGDVIGPVVAADIDDAKALISFFLARQPGAFTRIDTPRSSGLGAWLVEHGMIEVDTGIAMQRPALATQAHPQPALFALASQAFG